ncbi:unnamed protein product [Phytophthora fragariaefolia]|uniref:Unnamed protein product n=1 Tax=Phytophthora fragariaefolia TaxID=1490495 RepID=A0A9W6U7T9_9STRA|nr:unnamed protein product [Phytophthora fragariaefolia]
MILTGGTEVQPFNLFVSNRNASDIFSVGVVGSSVHSSHWRAVQYDCFDGDSVVANSDTSLIRNDGGLRAGSCIRLFHLETSSWLGFTGKETRDSSGGLVTLQYNDESEQEDSTKSVLSSDSLWEVERVSVYEGGHIKWRETITLRHLLTGKYLAVVHQQSPRAATRSTTNTRLSSHACAQAMALQQPQVFRFVPTAIADEDTQIENGDVVLIQHKKTNSFIHSIDTHASTMTDIRLSSKPLAHNFGAGKSGISTGGASFAVVALHGARDEDAFKIVTVPQTEVNDTLLLVSYKQALNVFLEQFRTEAWSDRQSFQFDRENTVIVFRRIEGALAELIDFCVSVENDSADQLKCRQSLFRTYQYIELLIEMIKAPFQCYGGPFSIEEVCSYNDEYMSSSRDSGEDSDELEMRGSPVRQRTGSLALLWPGNMSPNSRGLISPRRSVQDNHPRRKSTVSSPASSRQETHAAAMQSLNRIIPAINALLLHISWSNRTNELYVVKVAMPVLMELLGNGFQTSLPLSYLLRENRNLVESITGYSSIIRNFFELIVTRGKSIRYMQFLVALCTSRGKGVPKTQEAICELLFNPASGYRDDVIIPIRPSDNGFDICTSNHASSEVNQDIEVMFNRPAKIKQAASNTGMWMPLAKFYEEYYVKAKYRSLGQYCYGLFRLYASLCLDRNYVSIEYVQTAFPRENILSCVMDPLLARSLRSVMMDLLRVAYVDCEPQKMMSCPNYTRIWTDIRVNATKSLPGFSQATYSPEDLAFFSTLKGYCFSYLDRLQGAIIIDEIPENELTLAILRVARKMAGFGMYSTEEELSRFVVQLFDLLDERTDYFREIPEHSNIECTEANTKGYNSTSRQKTINQNTLSATKQRKVPLVSGGNDHGSGRGVIPQLSPHLKNAVLFDGAGAMSGIRITKERDASRQYNFLGKDAFRSSTAETSGSAPSPDSSPHRHLNKLLSPKVDLHSGYSFDVHEMNEFNRVVMEIKDEICAIFILFDHVRVDFLISTMLASFQARHGGPPSTSPTRNRDPDVIHTALFEDAIVRETVSSAFAVPPRGLPHGHHSDKISPLAVYLFGSKSLDCKLSLGRLGRRSVTTVFMQMLMYEYPPLVSRALELLLQQYNQHDQFLKELQNVQLLVSEETITIYNKLKGDVDELRRLAETTEVWMDLTSRSDFERASAVCQLLQSLTKAIELTKPDHLVINDEPKLGRGRRQLKLQNLGTSTSEESSSEDDGNSADLLATNSKCTPMEILSTEKGMRKPGHRISIEKQPPNRKLKHQANRYVLDPSVGRVSQYSGSHEVIPPFFASVTTEKSANVDKAISMEARRLLRNLRAAQFVLNMLVDGAHFYEGHISFGNEELQHSPGSPTTRSRTKLQKRQRDQIRGVFGKGMQFLRAFCIGDVENQALVAPYAPMIAQYVRDLPIAQELLVAIYADNFTLYNAVPIDLINIFVGRLIQDGPDPRYLFFLETLVLCNEQPIVENQLLVLFQLVKSFENAKVLQMFDDATQTIRQLYRLLERHVINLNGGIDANSRSITQDVSKSNLPARSNASLNSDAAAASTTDFSYHQRDTAADSDKMLEYHVRLLHLFAACATGKNTRAQEICQQILPLTSVLDLLSHDNCSEGFHLALLRFLDQVFLTADDIETPGADDLIQIMIALTQVCEKQIIKYLAYVQVKDLNRQATLSLRKNKSKAGKMVGLSTQKPLESAPLYLVIFSVVPTLYSFIQQFSIFLDNNEEAQYYLFRLHNCMALLLIVCATTKWQLPNDITINIEDFVYIVDKTVRVGMIQYQAPVQKSLEQLWLMSLKYGERLDCSSLDCKQELSDILQWALDKRDNELRNDSMLGATRSKAPDDLPDTSLSDTKDISPLGQAVRDNTSRDSMHGFNADDDSKATNSRGKADAPYKMDNLSANKPVTWGDAEHNFPHSEAHTNNVVKLESTVETFGTKPPGRLLHRLSPGRYYKGFRAGRAGLQYTSPKKNKMPVAHFLNVSVPEHRASSVSVGPSSIDQTEDINIIGRQYQQFNELGQFISWLEADPRVHSAMRDELNQMVQGILGIETSMKEEYNPHVHIRNVALSFDLVVAKLVEHVEALQDPSYLKTNLTLLNVFCRMIYAVGDAEERHNMQIKLNQLGVTRLIVQLIASRDSDALFSSSVEVGVALLDGMNAEVQESFYYCWSQPPNEKFFERIQDRIEKACKLIHSIDRVSVGTLALTRGESTVEDLPEGTLDGNDLKMLHQRHSMFRLNLDGPPGNKVADNGGSKRLGAPITSLFRFLQLLCEGHYLNAQRALIAQPHATVSANLVESTTSFLLDTYLALTDMDMGLITQLFETITEYCQGPCVEAQETVANYKFISAVNALLTHSFEHRDTRSQQSVHRLRAAIVVTLLSLLEGRSDRVLHAQLVQELNFEALKMNLVEVFVHFILNHGTYAGNSTCSKDFYLTMGFNIYILLQQLADQYPEQAWWIPVSDSDEVVGAQAWQPLQSSRNKVHSGTQYISRYASHEYRDAFRFFQSKCAKVEVVWDHRRLSGVHAPTQVGARTGGPVAEKTTGSVDVSGSFSDGKVLLDQAHTTGALIPFYFPIHPICFCLTNKSKKKLVGDVSRGADKLSDFYSRSDKLVDEMTHQSRLLHHRHISWIARKSEQIKRLSFFGAVIINLVVLLFYRAGAINSRPFAASEVTFIHTWGRIVEPPRPSLWIDAALSMAGTVLIILYSIVLMCYMLNSAPLLIKKGWKRRHRREQAKRSKQYAHSSRHRLAESKERETFQDTEHLLRSLREREEEYNYLCLPPSIRNRSRKMKANPVSPRIKSSVFPVEVKSATTNINGIEPSRSRIRVRLEILGISLYFLIRSPRVIYCLLQIFISILGSYVNKLYFAFLLLDVVERYKELNYVLRSISRPAKALGVTTILYLIVVYVFAVVGFFFFREDFTPANELTHAQREGRAPYTCQRLFQCFLVSLDQGLKSDGGLGTYLRQLPLGASAHSYGRLAFDVLYNILLVVLLLNLIFGVIIDTFASLRSDDQEKLLDMHGRCFICSIDAYTFDRATKRGFHDHVSRDHNMWHYLYLFVHIRKKNITEYNGLELFLAIRMAKKDMSFFPTHRALSLTKRGDLDESHETDASIQDGRFYAASSSFGSRRYAIPPLSPSRTPSLISRATSSHSNLSLDQRAHGKRSSSVSFHSASVARSMGYMEIPGAPEVHSPDRATIGKLEKIESTISALANAQVEIKEAQLRAEQRYNEILSAISGCQQQQRSFSDQSPISISRSMSSLSIRESSPSASCNPSIHAPGSVTPRIFNFESVTNDPDDEGVDLRPRGTQQAVEGRISSPPTSSVENNLASITPRTLNIETIANTEDNEANSIEEPQDWFLASPENNRSPHSDFGLVPSHSYELPSNADDMPTEYSASPDLLTLAQTAPGSRLQQAMPRQSTPRRSGAVSPRVFNFEFVSDDERVHKADSPRRRQRQL